jgi:dihydroorotate dehydrogenase
VYRGPGLIPEIVDGLNTLAEKDGFECIQEAVGIDVDPKKALK